MTIDDVKKLISKDETRTLELKKTTGELYKGMETACAFLNSDGGWLMFGVTPSLKIDGQNVTDNTRQEIANALRKIEPAIDVEVEYIELSEKPGFYVVAIYFDSNNFKNGPYSFDGRAFYKVESTTALMPRQMYEERLKLSNPRRFSWENTPNLEITKEDIIKYKLESIMDEYMEEFKSKHDKTKESYIRTILETFLKHDEFLKIIHNQNQSYILQKVFVNYFKDVLKDTSKKERYQIYYHIGGIYNFTICWIENGMNEQPECLAKIGAEITSNIEPYLLFRKTLV